MSRIMGSMGVPIIAILSLLMLSLGGCSSNDDGRPGLRPVAVRVTKPVIADMQNRLSYIGTVQSQQEVQVIAPVQGTVVDLPFAESEQISKGDVVTRIDAPELNATVERLRAEADYWCRRYESDQRLVAAEALPEEQMESTKRACRSARAALAEAESRLEKTLAVSPVDGEILRRFVDPGQTVMPGQRILMLGDERLEIQVEVVEEDLQRGIDIGTAAEIEDGWGNRFATIVSEVAPMATGITRTFLVRLPLAASRSAQLRTGSSVSVEFVLKASQGVVIVPVNAVVSRDRNPIIFVIRDQKALRQSVVLGIENDGWIEASFPWNGEDLIAVSNLGSLKDSISVFAVLVEETRP